MSSHLHTCTHPSVHPPQIRRAFRGLASKHHPDKAGGDADAFRAIQHAWEVLGTPARRAEYDATGRVVRGAEEEFMDGFAGGAYRDAARRPPRGAAGEGTLSEQLAVRQDKDAQSHTAGFEVRAYGWGRGWGCRRGTCTSFPGLS